VKYFNNKQKNNKMKQHSFKLRTSATVLALSGLMIMTSIPSFAHSNKIEILSSEAIQPTVKYIGTDDKGAGFAVKFDATVPVKFELTIKDKSGIVLYTRVFESASFSKTFRLMMDDSYNLKVSFTIKTLPDGSEHTFNVNTEEKTITDVAVTKTK
jgi:hypothetical protein